MNDTLVIGFGNTLRGDDGAGVRAAELIGSRYEDVDVLTVHELTPEISEKIAKYSTVVFIEASRTTTDLKVDRLEIQPGQRRGQSHVHTPRDLLALSWEVHKHGPAACVLMEIPAPRVTTSEELSAAAARAVNKCVEVFGRMFEPSSDTSQDME